VLVLHSSRSVGSLESSHQGMFPVESLLGISQRLNLTAVDLNFRTVEPVQHQSRSVESVEEASNPGVFQVESLLRTSQSVVELSSHSG